MCYSIIYNIGVVMHYDPFDVSSPSTATPFYINAEYIVELKSNPCMYLHLWSVGDFVKVGLM